MHKRSNNFAIYACWATLIAIIFLALHLAFVKDISLRKSFKDFPSEIDGWVGYDKEGSDYLAYSLGADDIFLRSYTNDDIKVELYFSFFRHIENQKGPHAPQLCWIGQGWGFKDLGEELLILNLKDRASIKIKKILAYRGGEKVLLIYCYKINDKYMIDFGQFRINAIFDTILKRKNCAFTLQLTTDLKDTNYFVMQERLIDFLIKALSKLEEEFLPS